MKTKISSWKRILWGWLGRRRRRRSSNPLLGSIRILSAKQTRAGTEGRRLCLEGGKEGRKEGLFVRHTQCLRYLDRKKNERTVGDLRIVSRLFNGPRCFLSVRTRKSLSPPLSLAFVPIYYSVGCVPVGVYIERGVITLRLIASLTSTDRTHPISLSRRSTISTYSFDNPQQSGYVLYPIDPMDIGYSPIQQEVWWARHWDDQLYSMKVWFTFFFLRNITS